MSTYMCMIYLHVDYFMFLFVDRQSFLTRLVLHLYFFFFFKQKTAYELRISDWSSDVCASDLPVRRLRRQLAPQVVDGGLAAVEFVGMMLRHIADPQARRAVHLAALDLQLVGDQPCQGRLAVAVGAEQADPVVRIEAQVEMPQHRALRHVADRRLLERQQRATQGLRHREGEAGLRIG